MNANNRRAALVGALFGLVSLTSLTMMMSCSTSATLGTSTQSPSGANTTNKAPPLEIVHEECPTDSSEAVKLDANGDGRPDVITVMSGDKKVCRASDLNLDGQIDLFSYYDKQGKLRRTEADYDRDGAIDEIATYRDGELVERDRETNLDKKLDTWDYYETGKLVRRLRDSNANGHVNEWWTFPDPDKPECPVVAYDTDGDGQPDSKIDVCKEREKEAEQQGFQPEPPAAGQPDAGTANDAATSSDSSSSASEPPAAEAGTSSQTSADGGAQ